MTFNRMIAAHGARLPELLPDRHAGAGTALLVASPSGMSSIVPSPDVVLTLWVAPAVSSVLPMVPHATMTGTWLNEAMTGTSRADIIFGNGGDDFIFGGLGLDLIIGGAGHDTLNGGSQRDQL